MYILRCADGTLYTGVARDVAKRVKTHNRGVGAKYTRVRLPVMAVYDEPVADRSAALKRELAIKLLSRAEKLQLIRDHHMHSAKEEPMFRIVHCNINVLDIERSVQFYREALGLKEARRKEAADGSFTLVFLHDGQTPFELELTCLHDRTAPYELGDNESHIAFKVADYEAAHSKHAAMGCICFENAAMGIYFIEDPDGYWLEIIPEQR